MKVYYQNREIGALGKQGNDTYFFTIKTPKMHRTIEYKAKSVKEAEKKAQQYLKNLINGNVRR